MQDNLIQLFILFIFALLSAFFSGSETALFSLKRSDLYKFSHSDDMAERSIFNAMKNPQNILITILIGNLVANLAMSVLTTKMLLGVWGDIGQFVSIGIVTPIIIIFCEIVPKLLAINTYVTASRVVYPFLAVLHRLLFPIRILISGYTEILIRVFGLKMAVSGITEDDLGFAVKVGEQQGHIHKEEGAFISNIMRFTKKEASNIMFPRNTTLFIPWGSSVKETVELLLEEDSVRAPVYKKDLDHVVGMIDARALMPYYLGYKKAPNINKFIEEMHFFPASRDLMDLMNDFLDLRIQIAIVVDEYGGTAGVVTLNSLLNELMGHEFRDLESFKKTEIRKIEDVTVISGKMQISDFNLSFGENINSINSDTIGGYFVERLSAIPKAGAVIRTDRHILKIKKLKKTSIDSIEVFPAPDDSVAGDGI